MNLTKQYSPARGPLLDSLHLKVIYGKESFHSYAIIHIFYETRITNTWTDLKNALPAEK